MGQGSSPEKNGTVLSETLRSVTEFAVRRPQATLCIALILACLSIGLTVTHLGFKTDRADLIDSDADFQQRWIEYTESFGDTSDIVVVVESKNLDAIKQTLEDLGRRLTGEPELFSHVFYKFDPGPLRDKGLHYLSPRQLQAGLSQFAKYRPVLEGRWDLIRLDALITRLETRLRARQDRRQVAAAGTVQVPEAGALPLLQHADLLTTSMSRFLADPRDFRPPWPAVVSVDSNLRDAGGETVYLLNKAGTMGFLKTRPVEEGDNPGGSSRSIERLRTVLGEVSAAHPAARISMTGIPVLESDEMRLSQTDMTKATAVSIIGVALLMLLGFRGVRHPVLALIMLAVALSWSLGYTTLAIGHLNILSISFAVMLVGLGIDFAIHYLARYLQLRHDGAQLQPALLNTSTGVGAGILTAAVTTALAFFCATFTQFLGVAELGVIVGGGILLCAVASFVVLPALVSLADQHVEPNKLPTPFEGRWLRTVTSRHPAVVFLASAVLIVGVGLQVVRFIDGRIEPRIRYDYNLLNLQAEGLESVEVQQRLFQNANDSLLFAVSVADSPEEARALKWEFEKLPSVDHVKDLASQLPAHPQERTGQLVQAFRARLSRLPPRPPRFATVNPSDIGRNLERLYQAVRNNPHPQAQRVAATLNRFLDRLERMTLRDQADFLNAFQYRAAASLLGQFQALRTASQTESVSLNDMPNELTSRFVSDAGQWLLQIYPREQIWDVEPLTRFVDEVRSVDPDVTGTPLQNYEASRQIFISYRSAALYALAAICLVLLIDYLGNEHKLVTLLPPLVVVVFVGMTVNTRGGSINPIFLVLGYVVMAVSIAAVLDFRNLRDALLVVMPPLAGGLLMLGVLGLLGIDLNPANLIVLPLVLGIGVDDGIHVVHDYRMQKEGEYRTSSSTINAIVLTSLTSMVGFGSLMLAAHRGLYSVGLVLVIGLASCLFVSLVTLPALLTLVDRIGRKGTAAAASQGKPNRHEQQRAKVA